MIDVESVPTVVAITTDQYFGERLREQRMNIGATQRECARMIGRSLRVWQYYEHGKRHMDPLIYQVWRIRAGLDDAESIYRHK